MDDLKSASRRDFLTISGRAGITTLVASAVGINLGLVRVVTAATSKKVTPFRFAILTDAHLFSIEDHKFDVFLGLAVDRVNDMKPRPDFVVYCGDISCGLPYLGALELAQSGFRAKYLLGGLAEWRRREFPIEISPPPPAPEY